MKSTENKVESIKKSSKECEIGYDTLEDIKKNKANISLFEMCNLTQQRKKSFEDLDAPTNKPQDDIHSEEEISEGSIRGNPNPEHYHFYFLSIFLIIMCTIVW